MTVGTCAVRHRRPLRSPPFARTRAVRDAELIEQFIESSTDDAICSLDPDGLVRTWNGGAERLTGYTAEEVLGSHVSITSMAGDRQADNADRALAIAVAEGHDEEEGWRVRKDGSPFWANVVTTAIRGQDGRLIGFGQVTRDLTERKRGEDALRASEEKFRSLVTSVADYAIFLLDTAGTIVSWNVGAERLKGYTADEIIGRDLSTFYTEDDRRAEIPRHALGEARERGRWESEGWRLRKDGTRFWANVVITALRHSDGELWGYAKVTRDLTDRKRNEDALRGVLAREREAATQLREADQLRKEVVAVIAHDLRAPIQVVQNLIHLLQTDDPTPDDTWRQDVVERVRVRLENMGALVDDIFELSRLEAGLLRTDLADIDMRAVVERVVLDTRTAFPTRTITLEADGVGRACADERRLGEVLTNLVSNAIKFSSDDTPVLVTIGDDNDLVVLGVRDYGTGVPVDQRTQIFQRFTRGSHSGGVAGSGLGLYIAKTFTEAMGGRLWLDSTVDGGSKFCISLPAAGPR